MRVKVFFVRCAHIDIARLGSLRIIGFVWGRIKRYHWGTRRRRFKCRKEANLALLTKKWNIFLFLLFQLYWRIIEPDWSWFFIEDINAFILHWSLIEAGFLSCWHALGMFGVFYTLHYAACSKHFVEMKIIGRRKWFINL